MAGCCEGGNDISSFIKYGEFLSRRLTASAVNRICGRFLSAVHMWLSGATASCCLLLILTDTTPDAIYSVPPPLRTALWLQQPDVTGCRKACLM
jgi:hypothetical protein